MSVHPMAAGVSCPECGYPFEESTVLNDPRPPAEGDMACCYNCGEFGIFAADGRVRVPTSRERFHWLVAGLESCEEMERMQAEIRRRGPIWPKKGEGVAG